MTMVEDAQPAARRLLEASSGGTVRIVAHPSGDGVAAAAILARALAREGRSFHVRFARHSEATLDADAEAYDTNLFLGLGAPRSVTEANLTTPTFLVDAVPGPWPRETKGLHTFNPVQKGEPVQSTSRSIAAFALAVAIDEANWPSAPLALAGLIACGGHRPTVAGWAESVRAEALKRGLLVEAPRPNLDDEALLDVLAFPPHLLDGLGGSYAKADAFLHEHRLPPEATTHELDEAGRQRFTSALALHLLRAGRPAAELARLVAPHLLQPATDLPLARVASWLDAAARDGEGGLALGYAMGDSEARTELEAIESKVRRRRRDALRRLQEGIDRRPSHALLAVDDIADAATIATLLATRWERERPFVVVTAPLGHDVHVSLRRTGTSEVDLGTRVTEAAREAGGQGGGRPDAAGARIPQARLGSFIEACVATAKELET